MKNDDIGEALGMNSLPDTVSNGDVVIKTNNIDAMKTIEHDSHSEYDDDVVFVKDNLKAIMEAGADALSEILVLAKQSQGARDFEVVNQTLNSLLNANKDYISVSEKHEKMKKDKGGKTTNVTNNNLIMSTNDMLKKLMAEDDKPE